MLALYQSSPLWTFMSSGFMECPIALLQLQQYWEADGVKTQVFR
ncbi:MAG: hypothetical protein AAFW70_24665 [Cyanobacteria bacterium J06635_10]